MSEGDDVDIEIYGRIASHLRRILETQGVERKARPIQQSIGREAAGMKKLGHARGAGGAGLLWRLLEGESWASWRVLLIAVMGEALTDAERVVFRDLTGRPSDPRSRFASYGPSLAGVAEKAGPWRSWRAIWPVAATIVRCWRLESGACCRSWRRRPSRRSSFSTFTAGIFDCVPRLTMFALDGLSPRSAFVVAAESQ